MSRITLEVANKDISLLIALAERLNASVVEVSEAKKASNKSPIYWLEKLANNGGVKSIPDPEKWQKETRKDKKLSKR